MSTTTPENVPALGPFAVSPPSGPSFAWGKNTMTAAAAAATSTPMLAKGKRLAREARTGRGTTRAGARKRVGFDDRSGLLERGHDGARARVLGDERLDLGSAPRVPFPVEPEHDLFVGGGRPFWQAAVRDRSRAGVRSAHDSPSSVAFGGT